MNHLDRDIQRSFRHHSRTFSLAARLLPRPVRMPIATLYVFCRRVDTIADERVRVVGAETAFQELGQIDAALRDTLAGHPPNDPFWIRLAVIHERYRLPEHALFDLLDGARWDLSGTGIHDEADLLRYSDLVGGCVGAMMLPFLVPRREEAAALESSARELGIAMQITNILRDVGEDRRDLDRLYLPADALARHGLSSDRLSPSPAYARLLEGLMRLAEARYITGFRAIDALPPPTRRGVRAAARMYREILNEIRAAGYDNLTRRAVVPFGRKMRLLFQDDYARRKAALKAPLATEPVTA